MRWLSERGWLEKEKGVAHQIDGLLRRRKERTVILFAMIASSFATFNHDLFNFIIL